MGLSRGRGGRSGGGGRSNGGGRSKDAVASVAGRSTGGLSPSSQSPNPSLTASGSNSQTPRVYLPVQYPNHTHPRVLQPQQQPPVPQPQQHYVHNAPPHVQIPQPQPQQPHILFPDLQQEPPAPEPVPPAPEPVPQDHQQFLDALLALPGREQLQLLSPHRIAGVRTIWFGRDKGKLSRVIAGIFRRKFDDAYYSWKVTPIHIQERYFRSFARKYNWEIGITELVKQEFLKIAKRRMKGIVSQVRRAGERPYWINPELWNVMLIHWTTPKAIERSATASQSRNSDRGGLGPHIHLSGQTSYLQKQEDMEEELGRPVSLGEVFLRTHTRADGTFVDGKAKLIAEAYEKNLHERISEMDVDDMDEVLPLSIEEQNEIFLQSTETDKKGNLFGLGSLVETIDKGKEKVSYGSSDTTILEMKSQLETANRKIAEHEADNARRDEEQRVTKERMSSMEMFIACMKIHNPSLASMDTQRPETTPATEPSASPDQT